MKKDKIQNENSLKESLDELNNSNDKIEENEDQMYIELQEERTNEQSEEGKATFHYDEDKNTVVKRKPLPRKVKLVLEHIGFIVAIMAVSVLLSFVYFESTQIDLEKYYIVGSYRVVSLEKLYPDKELIRESTSSFIGKSGTKKRFDQTIDYKFDGQEEGLLDEAYTKYVAELKDVVNGFNDLPPESISLKNENECQLVKKENSKVYIRVSVKKNTTLNKLTISIIYEVEA